MRWVAPLFLSLLTLACQGARFSAPSTSEPARAGKRSLPPPSGVERRAAVVVESIEIALGQSFPPQVRVLVRGHVSGACHLAEPLVERDGHTFRIVLQAAADRGEGCSGRQQFDRGVLLPTNGLPPGRYRVVVEGHETAFTLAPGAPESNLRG